MDSIPPGLLGPLIAFGIVVLVLTLTVLVVLAVISVHMLRMKADKAYRAKVHAGVEARRNSKKERRSTVEVSSSEDVD